MGNVKVPETAIREREIPISVANLQKLIQENSSLSDELTVALVTILQAESDAPPIETPSSSPVRTSLGDTLSQLMSELSYSNQRLHDVLQRLEV